MIGDVIDTFGNTASAVNQKFVRRSQVHVTGSHTRKFDVNQVFSCSAVLFPND